MNNFSVLRKNSPPANKIEEGVWLHVRSWEVPPGEEEGPPLYADAPKNQRPVRVRVRSPLSKHFQNADSRYTANLQAKASRLKAKDRKALMERESEGERARRFSWLVAAIENMDLDDLGVQVPDEAQLYALASLNPDDPDNLTWFVNQVMSHAYEPSNFGNEADAGGNAPDEDAPAAPSESSSTTSGRPRRSAS